MPACALHGRHVLKLDATMGLQNADAAADEAAKLTTQEPPLPGSRCGFRWIRNIFGENDKKPAPRLAITPQDVRF